MSTRQTVTFLRQRFADAGVAPDTRKGQNFLIDLNLVRLLADAANLSPHDVVLEVGTGVGSLTAMLAAQAGAVVSVEIDPRMHQLAREELRDHSNLTLLRCDALKNKNNLEPQVLECVSQQMRQVADSRFKVVANLPYNVATPIISNLLQTPLIPESMSVTIQKELADRILAPPGIKDYGALSIWMQSQCELEIIRELPPSVFWPRPKVSSVMLQIRPQPAMQAAIPDRTFFHTFVRSMFFHRRKILRSELLAAFPSLSKPDVDALLEQHGFDGNVRAEQLSWQQMLALCEAVRGRQPDSP